jgi:phosphatidylinositol glycan class K
MRDFHALPFARWRAPCASSTGMLRLLLLLLLGVFAVTASSSSHTSNYAVIVGASRYWFNYRHAVNALSIYNMLKQSGNFTDDKIVLMLADEFPTNSRNPFKNSMDRSSGKSLYNDDTHIDYRGEDVTVQNFVNVLTGRQPNGLLPILNSDSESHVLIYLTGHGGDQFFKFQDEEEILAAELAAVFRQMHDAGKYREILLIADTCQAFTLGDKIDAPNVTVIGSSLRGESSYAHHSDADLGLSVIERYTYAFKEYVASKGMKGSLQQTMVDPYSFEQQRAHVGASDKMSTRKLNEVPLSDFFNNVATTRATSTRPSTDDSNPLVLVVAASRKGLFQIAPAIPSAHMKNQSLFVDTLTYTTSMQCDSDVTASVNRPEGGTEQLWEPSDPRFLGLVGLFAAVLIFTSWRC